MSKANNSNLSKSIESLLREVKDFDILTEQEQTTTKGGRVCSCNEKRVRRPVSATSTNTFSAPTFSNSEININ